MPVTRAQRTGTVRIACINKARTPLGVPMAKLTKALQACFDRHFLPVWGYPVRLYNTKKPKRSDWQLVYFEDADQAGALGYHDLTKNGQPVSKVFVKTTIDDGELVSVTACHELFEMVIDPLANLWAQGTHGREFAYEMCDAVEEDTFKVHGVAMSNFVHPSWFEPFKHPRGTRFDHLGRLSAPFTMTDGGYVIVKKKGRVKERCGSRAKAARFAKENRRGHRSEFRKGAGGLHIAPRTRKRKA
ncbi:MAG TPA: hypothetical protein VLT91_12410 [Rhizomicrobium sp.]|nr:hypothetical protein [Rhizomicrobium sp.]